MLQQQFSITTIVHSFSMPAPSNPKRASSTSYAMPNWNPRRTSTYGQIMAENSNNSAPAGTPIQSSKRHSAYHPLHPRHRNQSFKAHVSRLCPSFFYGPARRRALWLLCAAGTIVLIYCLSSWRVDLSPSFLSRSSLSTRGDRGSPSRSSSQQYSEPPQDQQAPPTDVTPETVNPRTAFMARDFGVQACHATFGAITDKRIKVNRERDQNRVNHWHEFTKNRTWALQVAWKATLKKILPNWKEHSRSWIGRGVLLTAFTDDEGQSTVERALVQIKLIRSMSQIPIELWFERSQDVTEEVEEMAAMWNAEIRYFDDRLADYCDSTCVQVSDSTEPIPGLVHPAIRLADIDEVRRDSRNTYSIKTLTIAAMINSGFEEFVYYSPAALPMQPPQTVFLEKSYVSTGAVFWQDPSSLPSPDSPIWPTIHSDCITTSFEQSWTVMALNHQKSWKGLFLAWIWLTGDDAQHYQRIFGKEARDLMRMAWVATRRQYAIVDRMPAVALQDDWSKIKGDGIACNLETTLYPAIGSDVLTLPPSQFLKLQKKRAYKKTIVPYGNNVFVLDTARNSLIGSASGDENIHLAVDEELGWIRDASQHVFTDAYAAGYNGRVCLQLGKRKAGRLIDE
ncbi:hypothetical protein BGZ73_006118 [Actinomortierella ambigua]|nr:hypothetical protein BGZ73_006118 [Actinomortierella ambigua]